MTLENNRTPLLHYIKLCASFQSHRWIQTGVTVWKRSIRVKIGDFLSRLTLKLDGWPYKTIGHLFCVASSFVYHYIAISDSIYSYSPEAPNLCQNRCFLSLGTLQFDRWPWKTIGHLFYPTLSFVHHFIAIGEFKLELQSGNIQFGSKSMFF